MSHQVQYLIQYLTTRILLRHSIHVDDDHPPISTIERETLPMHKLYTFRATVITDATASEDGKIYSLFFVSCRYLLVTFFFEVIVILTVAADA